MCLARTRRRCRRRSEGGQSLAATEVLPIFSLWGKQRLLVPADASRSLLARFAEDRVALRGEALRSLPIGDSRPGWKDLPSQCGEAGEAADWLTEGRRYLHRAHQVPPLVFPISHRATRIEWSLRSREQGHTRAELRQRRK